jgi:thioesterase domain-containing protein/acyl carrier protein
VPGKEILLLDENRQEIPVGQVGEIAVRTRFMFSGYWNRPDLTDAKFIPDPENPGQRLYLGGDLGRFRPDGQLVFMGRKDFRLKIRGFSVDPPAIEGVLMQVEGVRRAVVMAPPDSSGEKRLVAYVMTYARSNTSTETLRAAMTQALPNYMIPSFIVFLDQFPLTAGGKVNYRVFPDPIWDTPNISSSYAPPRSNFEEKMAGIWQEVLGLSQVGIHDDFFDLGGHSLLAVRLCSEIKTSFGRSIAPANLITYNTIERLSTYLNQLDNQESLLVPIQTQGAKPPLFVAPGMDGDIFYYLNLSGHLGKDQPMYGMQLMEAGSRLPPDLEDMAAYFVKEIRAVQPAGPYHLLGHSFGGHLVFEMARQLVKLGEKIAFLGLLDTHFPTPEPMPSLQERIKWHVQNFKNMPISQWPQYVFAREQARFIGMARNPIVQYVEKKARLISNDVSLRNHFARRGYIHKSYPGKISMFRVKNPKTNDFVDPLTADWKAVAAEIEFYDAPGDHKHMLHEPYVTELAKLIQKALAQIT